MLVRRLRCEGAGSRPPIDLLCPVAGDGLLDPSAGSRELSKPKGLHPSWLLKVSCVDEVDRSSKVNVVLGARPRDNL